MDLIKLKRIVLAVGAAATLVIFLRAAGTVAALFDLHTLAFLGWCLLPIGHLWTFGRDDDPEPSRLFLLAGAAIVVIFGLWVYVDTLVIHRDPNANMAFIIVPLMQLAVVVPVIAAAWLFRRRTRVPA